MVQLRGSSIDSSFSDAIARYEDPLDNPFSEAVHFDGVGYIVLPDPARESSYILRHLLKSAFGHSGVLVGSEVEQQAKDELRALRP